MRNMSLRFANAAAGNTETIPGTTISWPGGGRTFASFAQRHRIHKGNTDQKHQPVAWQKRDDQQTHQPSSRPRQNSTLQASAARTGTAFETAYSGPQDAVGSGQDGT